MSRRTFPRLRAPAGDAKLRDREARLEAERAAELEQEARATRGAIARCPACGTPVPRIAAPAAAAACTNCGATLATGASRKVARR